MSMRYKGGIISATAPTTSSSAASGVWTRQQQMQAIAGSGWPSPPIGSQSYTTAGTYSWVVPTGVNKVSVVIVGNGGKGANGLGLCALGGGGGGGGGLVYGNNLAVTPGSSIPVKVASGSAGVSYFAICTYLYANGGSNAILCSAGIGGLTGGAVTSGGANGGRGGCSGFCSGGGGGGGAAGYTGLGGTGGNGGNVGNNAAASSGGGGGGGGGNILSASGGGGGGVGILGKGCTGTGGSTNSGGVGGSGGANGANQSGNAGLGGAYGGGGGGGSSTGGSGRCGGSAAVRIIWPGCSRSFPSTNTGSP